MPEMTIVVPPFLQRYAIVDPPVVYSFMGGSLREGLLAHINVLPDPRLHANPRRTSLPRCDGPEHSEQRGDRDVVTCDEPNGRAIYVTRIHGKTTILCSARWTRHGELSTEQTEVVRGIEAACFTLEFR